VKSDPAKFNALLTTGTASDNILLSNWRGAATINGTHAASTVDTLSINRDRDQDLNDGSVVIKKQTGSATEVDKTIAYSNIDQLTVSGGDGFNTFTLNSKYDNGLDTAPVGLTIKGNNGNDTLKTSSDQNITVTSTTTATNIAIGSRTLNFTTFQTPEIVNFTSTASNAYTFTNYTGRGSLANMNSVAFSNNVATSYTATNNNLAIGLKNFSITGALAGGMSLTGSALTDTFTVNGWTKGLSINGGANNSGVKDTFAVTTTSNNVILSGNTTAATFSQSPAPTWNLQKVEIARITGSSTTGQTFTLSGWAHGGTLTANATSTADRLVYSHSGNMTLTNGNLTAGTKVWTLANIDSAHLTAGTGNDVVDARTFSKPVTILGGDGNDILLGGSGQDILVGGRHVDRLNSIDGLAVTDDTDEDILIGGTTSHDQNTSAMLAILNEWAKSGPGFAFDDRITTIKTVITSKLNKTTVQDDNAIDVLFGGDASDWYFHNLAQEPLPGISGAENNQKIGY
jgi:hypothetical protein